MPHRLRAMAAHAFPWNQSAPLRPLYARESPAPRRRASDACVVSRRQPELAAAGGDDRRDGVLAFGWLAFTGRVVEMISPVDKGGRRQQPSVNRVKSSKIGLVADSVCGPHFVDRADR
jgi:hypothetical protein